MQTECRICLDPIGITNTGPQVLQNCSCVWHAHPACAQKWILCGGGCLICRTPVALMSLPAARRDSADSVDEEVPSGRPPPWVCCTIL
jgi:hypothetical protein